MLELLLKHARLLAKGLLGHHFKLVFELLALGLDFASRGITRSQALFRTGECHVGLALGILSGRQCRLKVAYSLVGGIVQPLNACHFTGIGSARSATAQLEHQQGPEEQNCEN